MAQFDYEGTVSSGNRNGTLTYYETLNDQSSFTTDGNRLFYNLDMNTNVVGLITD